MSEDSQASPEILEFEGYELDPLRRVLSRDGEIVQVTGKALDCLVALIRERDRVVTRAELMDAVWSETYVEESNLTQNISVLRRALGEGARDHRFIVTIPGRGYRFVASVRSQEDSENRGPGAATATTGSPAVTDSNDASPDFGSRRVLFFAALWLVSLLLLIWWLSYRSGVASSPSATSPASPADQIRSLAVLPFVSLGQETSDSKLLGLGMADALITRLSRVHNLSIRPTSSILRWKDLELDSVEVGSALGVDAILSGTLQRSENRVRVTTQLTRVSDRATIWAGTFERDFTGIFAVQDSISLELLRALTRELTREERRKVEGPRAADPEAYEAYLRGRMLLTRRSGESMRAALEEFRTALQIDPAFASASAGIANVYFLQAFYDTSGDPPLSYYERSLAAVQRALALDDRLAEAHVTLGYLRYQLDFDYEGAEASFRRALEIAPGSALAHHWYGWALLAMGREQEAMHEIETALELDPLSLIRNTARGMHAYFVGDYDRSLVAFYSALDIDPDFGRAHIDLGEALAQMGRLDEALGYLENSRTLLADSTESISAIGHLHGLRGDRRAWQESLEELEELTQNRYVSPYRFAILYVAVGEDDKALDALEKAIEDRAAWPVELRYDPKLDPLRDENRFAELLAEAGIL